MRPDARLDSVVFQLTPTRTRFDLVLIVNGRKEKLASGLLKPFLAHLKAAQDQIAKGGYSITLEPSSGINAPWFTRGTVERFVRFVSTPEVLERVTTLESEILQLEDAIAIQGNDNLGLRSVEDHGRKLTESNEGGRVNYDPAADTAIVVYKPGSHPMPPVQNETTAQEENSKVQLLRVLESRKTVLRKEQAMAFARAVAAGFETDSLGYLIAFAERFGASRLMKACSQFIELWKQKHETGQWIEVEPEAMSTRSEFPPFNASGIVFMGDNMKQNMESGSVPNGEANGEDGAKADQKPGQQMGYQAAYPPWAMHPPSGAAVYPPYPMQGVPFYPGVNPYYSPYPPVDDPRHHYSGRKSSRKHSSDSKDSETLDVGSDSSSSERGSSHGRKSHRKGKRSGKKKPSVVVIRNVNVTSKKHGLSETESQSNSDVGSEDSDDSHSKSREGKHKSSSSKKKKEEGRKTTFDSGDEYSKDETSNGQNTDQGNWSAFQNFLLRAEEKTRASDADLFAGEKEPPSRRKKNVNAADPILLAERDSGNVYEQNTVGFDSASGRTRTRTIRVVSNDELVMTGEGRSYMDGEIKEIEAGGGRYRRGTGDDFMVYGQERQIDRSNLLDPLAEARYKSPTQKDKNMNAVADESFMIPLRSNSLDNFGAESRTAIDIGVELPTSIHKMSDGKAGNQLFYEPDELMPERGFEDVPIGYDPAMDYNSHMLMTTVKVEDIKEEDVLLSINRDVKKAEIEKLRNAKDGSDKRRKDALLRRLSAPKTPLNDAQKRAQNLRAYKADLQKLKKEQEEEQIKRLERLKLERQKRIAAKGNGKSPGSNPPKANSINGLSKSVPSFSGVKKEKNGTTESFSDRLKRLSEPKSIAGVEHSSNAKSTSADHSRRRSMA
ncbi:COP1-interacting protein 7-like [Phragmites australis]|uniref:COP1-interacting protein 7-like n=1 Tax=Phragmites australis TaxID=29695 RepID=UPI002D7911B4|nr:COP1-interacting protein 7-like [Phragmites australis]